ATHDTAFALALFAQGIRITSATGAVKTREQEIADVRPSPGLTMNYFRTEDVAIHVYADTAVVVGNAQWEFTTGGQMRTLRRRYSARYTRGGSLAWRMVELHLFDPPAALSTSAPVPPTTGVEGRWQGRLPSGLNLVLDVTKAADGLLFATLISVDQGNGRVPIEQIVQRGDSVHAELRTANARYDGVISADRLRLNGIWTSGTARPLDFTRMASAPPELLPVRPPSPFGLAATLSVPVPPTVVAGDGKRHLVYGVHIGNYAPAELLLTRFEVFDGAKALLRVEGRDLAAIVSQSRFTNDTRSIQASGTAIVYVWVTLDSAGRAPTSLRHRITANNQTTEAVVPVAPLPAIVIGPPLRGADWVANNGPGNSSVHRRSLIPVGGRVTIPQRFATDWGKRDADGRMFQGDEKDNKSYFGYGADVIAVVDAIVVRATDGIPENVPGFDSRAVPMTPETISGNHVILDLGQGRYAFYAHLVPGSVRVKIGDRVKRGQLLGRVGNSGNSTGPHLHFQICDSISSLGSEGLPYVIDSWELQRSPGTWERRTREIPLQNVRVRFPG
ncbi:MAG TPA: peptidoglycan DD-metalloendopeptidase family protein, partial [Burkholderiales bacterium]|nr:peptidoglycan DD-metalloendopeptidase family protein [Burkholderiales bacterium]